MVNRKLRRSLLIIAWVLTFASAPYTTAVVLRFDPERDTGVSVTRYGFVSVGAALFTGALFVMALLYTKLNDEFEAALVTKSDEEHKARPVKEPEEELLPEGYDCGLRLLRVAINSPLRGKVSEKGIILALNGHAPKTAAEANSALVTGSNEVEWVDRQGKIETTAFITRKKDLCAQFEQVPQAVQEA